MDWPLEFTSLAWIDLAWINLLATVYCCLLLDNEHESITIVTSSQQSCGKLIRVLALLAIADIKQLLNTMKIGPKFLEWRSIAEDLHFSILS